MNELTQEHRRQVQSFSNTRVIHFKYLGPTNHRGARIKLTDKWFKKSKTIPFDYSFSTSYHIAISWLIQNGWNVVGMNTEDGVIFIGDWNSDKQLKE